MSDSRKMYVGLVCLALLVGCATSSIVWAKEPGLYNFTGWNDATWGIDINGEVGYPVYVGNPKAECYPSGKWTLNTRVASGSLPPGLTLGSAPFSITGIPTERGHWIVKLETYDVRCEGGSYKGFEQELRFHITGSGKVVQ